jgi:hypothetical protein
MLIGAVPLSWGGARKHEIKLFGAAGSSHSMVQRTINVRLVSVVASWRRYRASSLCAARLWYIG